MNNGSDICVRRGERGVALVLVLGLLALISAWAVQAASEDQISIHRSGNLQTSTRAMLAAESGWELASAMLREDRRSSEVDDLNEDWAPSHAPYPLDNGEVKLAIEDANRYYNLNDLVKDGAVQPQELAHLKKLLALVGLSSKLADALADWMDADDLPTGYDGAEQGAYADKPYRAKNAPLDSWDELSLVKGFDAEVMAKLSTVATVAPSNGITKVNINTAPKVVLMALFDGMSESDAESLVQSRQSAPYTAVQLAALPKQPFAGKWATAGAIKRLAVTSDLFVIRSQARFGKVRWGEKIVAGRDAKGGMHILSRERLGWASRI